MLTLATVFRSPHPSLRTTAELLKPITWFPPMWAFACGAVASGVPIADHWWMLALGMMLAGPLVCATSQAVNDWFDRHVDAINEPSRPIPSGRMPGRWGLGIAIAWTLLSLAVSTALGLWGFLATVLGLALAWAYSAPPLRLKRNGWWGNSACALSYEGIAWFTGSAVMLGGMLPAMPSIVLALLFSFGAHGIMTLNDFKAVQGDLKSGIRSLPAQLGIERAAKVACWMMALAQVAVVGVLVVWNQHGYAMGVSALLAIQILLMRKLLASPRERAPWYNGTGITLYVSAMMISAFAVRGL